HRGRIRAVVPVRAARMAVLQARMALPLRSTPAAPTVGPGTVHPRFSRSLLVVGLLPQVPVQPQTAGRLGADSSRVGGQPARPAPGPRGFEPRPDARTAPRRIPGRPH